MTCAKGVFSMSKKPSHRRGHYHEGRTERAISYGARRTRRLRPDPECLEARVTLSVFRVNTTLDTVAVNLKTGRGAGRIHAGQISLRSAIEAANSRPNADMIVLPHGAITLTIPGAGEDSAATGDLDIRGNVKIKGQGQRDDHRRQQP